MVQQSAFFVHGRAAQYGVPGGIRTPDLLVRSQALYPAELQAHRPSSIRRMDYYSKDLERMQHFLIFYGRKILARTSIGKMERKKTAAGLSQGRPCLKEKAFCHRFFYGG